MECTVEGTAHGVHAVDAVDGWPRVFQRGKPHRHVNAPYDEDALLGFYLARHVRHKAAPAGIDPTRLQRASKGATIQPAVAAIT